MTRKTNKPSLTRKEALEGAAYATLRGRAVTDAAKGLVEEVRGRATAHDLKSGKRRQGETKPAPVAAVLADLLYARTRTDPNPWVYRSLHAQSFTGEPVGHKIFKSVTEAMKALKLVEQAPGVGTHWIEGFNKFEGGKEILGTAKSFPGSRKASRFKATDALVALSAKHGVPIARIGEHFEFDFVLPAHPLQLREANATNWQNQNKLRGKLMSFEYTPHVLQLEADVRELNAFLSDKVKGALHHGYIRIFQNGNQPGFAWNAGGRLYSQPAAYSYQQLSKAHRLKLKLGGEAVVEIDIRASYLTIFHAWYGQQLQLPSDPYTIAGLGPHSRDIVKLWLVATFGNRKPLTKWPLSSLADYEVETGQPLDTEKFSPAVLRAKTLAKFPLLSRWGELHDGRHWSWADLMFQESEVVVATMLELMRDRAVPSLAVHDSIIVPQSKKELAERTLVRNFQRIVGSTPQLTAQRQQPNLVL